jgi:hypothetical protein
VSDVVATRSGWSAWRRPSGEGRALSVEVEAVLDRENGAAAPQYRPLIESVALTWVTSLLLPMTSRQAGVPEGRRHYDQNASIAYRS